jgi:hypothetical protein
VPFSKKHTTTPSPPITGYSHPKCYARNLHDCSIKISKEHYISDNLLKFLLTPGKTIIEGAHWLSPGVEKNVSPQSMGSKVLCDRHNSALSGLDALAQKFFTFILSDEPNPNILLLNGNELERWFMKVMYGLIASGSAMKGSKDLTPPAYCLDILFYNKYLSEGSGLYFVKGPHSTQFNRIAVNLIPLNNNTRVFIGMFFMVAGFPFLFVPERVQINQVQGLSKQILEYRPATFLIIHKTNNIQKEVHFGWPKGSIFTITKLD